MSEPTMAKGSSLPENLKREALAMFVHRYTMEHVPRWAQEPAPNGKFYAPQYASDQEWLERTRFAVTKGGSEFDGRANHCDSADATWPLGQWLDEPFSKAAPAKAPRPR